MPHQCVSCAHSTAPQNDRYLIDGCLAALQRGNDESAAANAKIEAAFAALQKVG